MEKRLELEERTRDQASSGEWLEACRCRITGSECGRIIKQKEKTTALYPKPMLFLPKPIAWGGKKSAEGLPCLCEVHELKWTPRPCDNKMWVCCPPTKVLAWCFT